MSQYEEFYDNERIEKDTFRSMRELSKYSKILSKENNIFIFIKKIIQIKLKSSKSFFKISSLLDTLPEENISFAFYIEEKSTQKEAKANNITNNKEEINNKSKIKPKSPKNNEKMKKNSIYLIDNIDTGFSEEMYKKGNIIGYNHDLFKNIWIYLYKFCFVFSLILFIGFIIYSIISLSENKYYILGCNVFTLINLFIIIYGSYCGNKKIESKKKLNFRKENIILLCFIYLSAICGILWIYIYTKKENELKLYILVCIETFLGLEDIISVVLIYLNVKMFEFYAEYSDKAEEGISLVDI